MGTYLMFGEYSLDAMREISADRTKDTRKVIEEHGGKYVGGYALLGDVDLILIVDLPDTEAAMQTSAALSRMLGISFSTAPAVSVEDFDRIMT